MAPHFAAQQIRRQNHAVLINNMQQQRRMQQQQRLLAAAAAAVPVVLAAPVIPWTLDAQFIEQMAHALEALAEALPESPGPEWAIATILVYLAIRHALSTVQLGDSRVA